MKEDEEGREKWLVHMHFYQKGKRSVKCRTNALAQVFNNVSDTHRCGNNREKELMKNTNKDKLKR